MFAFKKYFYTISVIILLIWLGSFSSGFHYKQPDPNSPFAGSETCKNCHKEIFDSHIKTAHYLTSKPADEKYIKGSFKPGENEFVFNKAMRVMMEKKDGTFFQTAYLNGNEYQSERMDIVIGSGRKGQTFLYWNDNRLFQLPVSYYVAVQSWCNSPGYRTNLIHYDRIIPARCIECHGTYAKTFRNDSIVTVFDPNGIIYGVDCERCHGPAAAHVLYHTANPDDKKGKYVINPKSLDRSRRLDACALCHSGFRKAIRPEFSYMEGDKLEDYSLPTYNDDTASSLDVHGNQFGLLTASKCFRSSTMDCSSCHNVHQVEINQPKIFSQRCMSCHNEASGHLCKMSTKGSGFALSDNCIDCHMPLLPSSKIFLQLNDPKKSSPDFVRTHRIGIYPKQTKEFIKNVKMW